MIETVETKEDQATGIISVELFDPQKHYESIAHWWTAQSWPVVPLSHLPGTGVVVLLSGKPAAAAWIYKTDSPLCWLEWIVADPKVRRGTRASVLSTLISSGKMLAQVMGFQSVYVAVQHSALGGRLAEQGFEASDHGVTNYICKLGGRSCR